MTAPALELKVDFFKVALGTVNLKGERKYPWLESKEKR